MEVKRIENPADGGITIMISTSRDELLSMLPEAIWRQVVEKASEHIAAEVIEKKGVEIYERVSPEAIANLAVAEGANAIKDMLDKKLPDKIVHETRTEVYQRGILGGLNALGRSNS